MKILHIANGYHGSTIYQDLFQALEKLDFNQKMHIPGRVSNYGISRLFFFRKIRRNFREIEPISENFCPDIIHAHTLLSDGGIAHKLFKKTNTPYIVALRYTDLLFLKYLFFFRSYARKILKSARSIILISPGYKEQLLSYLPEKGKKDFLKKLELIPNGMDSFWNQNSQSKKEISTERLKLLYVGDIILRKNVLGIIKAVEILKSQGQNLSLTIVGWRQDDSNQYAKRVKKKAQESAYIDLVERTEDQESLLEYYRQADIFLMPSFGETFGLSYIEAMSQGLPVIYSKGQGIDGYFKDGEVGFAVNPRDPLDIGNKIKLVKKQYSEISTRCISAAKKFEWGELAKSYQKVYED